MKKTFFAAAACLLLVFCCSAGHIHAEETAAATPTRPCLTICCWPGGAAARGMAACPGSAIMDAWSVMMGR